MQGGGATTLIGVFTFLAGVLIVLVLVVEVVLAVEVDAQITTDPPEMLEPTLTLPDVALKLQAAEASLAGKTN